jgi:hypothetical protein
MSSIPRKSLWHNTNTIIQTASKFLKLQLLPAQVSWKARDEPAKIAFFRNHVISALQGCSHLTPLGSCLALITLNAKVVFLGDAPESTRTALQFAGKLLEVLNQTSLAVILLSFVRHLLFSEESLPLGTVMAPLNIANIAYCWSLELWGSFAQRHLGSWKKYLLLASVPAIVVLAAAVGPSGTVLLIPREMNFTVFTENFLLDSADSSMLSEINTTLL